MVRIGDVVEAFLRRFGVTAARMPGGCKCKQRQKKLNEFGYRLQRDAFNRLAVIKRRWGASRFPAVMFHLSNAVRVLFCGKPSIVRHANGHVRVALRKD